MSHRKDGQVLIEIKLTTVIQLFNSFDPAPFYEKEIDTEAEHYIVDTVRDFPAKTKFKIHIYLPPPSFLVKRPKRLFLPSITISSTRCWLPTVSSGRDSGLAGSRSRSGSRSWHRPCLPAVVATMANHFLAELLSDSLLIIGWAAMWEPITVLLYELWPILRTKKIYEKISTMEIDILPLPG